MYPFYNPYKIAIQKYLFEILHDRYILHQHTIDRLTHYLVTENDIREFAALIGDIYQIAYVKSAKDIKGKMSELGYNLDMTHDVKPVDKSELT